MQQAGPPESVVRASVRGDMLAHEPLPATMDDALAQSVIRLAAGGSDERSIAAA